MARKDEQGNLLIPLSDAWQSLFELRSQVITLHGIYLSAEDIDKRIQASRPTQRERQGLARCFRRRADRGGCVGRSRWPDRCNRGRYTT